MSAVLCLRLALLLVAVPAAAADDDVLRNPFHDPMLQVTQGMAACPVPDEPLYTEKQYRELAHERSQRGVSCWLAGRCRLPNGYLYDAEIIPRVAIAINERSSYTDTSVWALGQRRRVWLRGCVQTARQAEEIEAIVRHLDDVEDVQNELMVGSDGVPKYVVRKPRLAFSRAAATTADRGAAGAAPCRYRASRRSTASTSLGVSRPAACLNRKVDSKVS